MRTRVRDPDGVRTVLQLDPALREALAEVAQLNERTLHGEIRAALREHAERELAGAEARA